MSSYPQYIEFKSKAECCSLEDLDNILTIKAADPKYQDWQYKIELEIREQKRLEKIQELKRQELKINFKKDKKSFLVKEEDDGYCYLYIPEIKREVAPVTWIQIPPVEVWIDKDQSIPTKLKIKRDPFLELYEPEEVYEVLSNQNKNESEKNSNNTVSHSFSKDEEKPIRFEDIKYDNLNRIIWKGNNEYRLYPKTNLAIKFLIENYLNSHDPWIPISRFLEEVEEIKTSNKLGDYFQKNQKKVKEIFVCKFKGSRDLIAFRGEKTLSKS